MKTLASTIVSNIHSVRHLIELLSDSLIDVSTDGALAQNIISNTKLLLEKLLSFYSSENNADFFPHTADMEINNPLIVMRNLLDQFVNGGGDHVVAHNFLMNADMLYSNAMKLGLVTFGLDANSVKSLNAEMMIRNENARKSLDALEKTSQELISKAQKNLEEAKISLGRGDQMADLYSLLKDGIAEGQGIRTRMHNDLSFAMSNAAEIEKRKIISDEIINSLNQELSNLKAEVKSMTESRVAASSTVSIIQDTVARAKAEFDEIANFYEKINTYKTGMIEIRKESEAKYNVLIVQQEEGRKLFEERYAKINQDHIAHITENEGKSKDIINLNQRLHTEIRQHLQHAVGVSLFEAFDVRRKGLGRGKWFWAVLLIAGVIAGGCLSWWLANSLSAGAIGVAPTGLEPAFFVKLSAIIPISFLVIFSAKQYGSERRAEEEYAFKSAISLSLMPYKELLQKMKIDGLEPQAAFVEKLMQEIFDNPVSRVYSGDPGKKSTLEKAMTFKEIKNLIAISKDLDVEKIKRALELLNGDTNPRP